MALDIDRQVADPAFHTGHPNRCHRLKRRTMACRCGEEHRHGECPMQMHASLTHLLKRMGCPTAFHPEWPLFMYFASNPASFSLIAVLQPTWNP